MDMYDSLFSESCVLNEQIARHLFEVLVDRGPVMVIMDRDFHTWPSDSERFAALNLSELFLRDLCAKVDDGNEPVVTQEGDCSIIASQLSTDKTNCGYAIIAMPQQTPESTLVSTDLIEIILSQMNLVAKLIEKNNLLYELQMKQSSSFGQGDAASN